MGKISGVMTIGDWITILFWPLTWTPGLTNIIRCCYFTKQNCQFRYCFISCLLLNDIGFRKKLPRKVRPNKFLHRHHNFFYKKESFEEESSKSNCIKKLPPPQPRSVTRLGDFWKFLITNILARVAKCLVTFRKALIFKLNVKLRVDTFWATFGKKLGYF